ncbi:leucine-rich repeat flightless-interacting protein 1 isoform X7 [Oncorhynchus tshawytscha]|uniref:leucine-rich repeat flightless-interacting protein 1 isoform X7 n=1 Tax=Oncorhynchus tshawytscha TaxID=74940 RepID=UPI001C3DA5AC|nr:leucine-rich repeat flightless-interacting protein 1 isoform X7 [Oncorhynchus tshawytscha]
MGTQITGTGRKRIPNRERLTAEDDALNQIAREAEARLAAKRAARAEAREIRMKELERQQKEVYQSQKKYYGLDNKWGHIEQWMEESERYSSRPSRRHTSISDDEERMSVGSRGSLRRNFSSDLYCSSNSLPSLRHQNSTQNGRPSDYSGFLGSNSRASSRASSARASPVVEERSDRDFLEKGSRTASTLSAATLASLGGPSSRRGSCDTSISVETEASIREIKDSLVESEEKYRKAMVSNAQLHNEKSNLMYQVDTLKDSLIELEEQLYESKREYNDKAKEFERERHAHSVLQRQFKEMRETLKQSEELLTEVGQLRLKRDSCVREISDLQETLGWKEKKIGALERQREFSDAGVRDEREKLRDQVVHLKDTLKKHGIVLSPEVTTNGDAGQMIDGPRSADSTRLAQESQPSHGGESMLGEAPEMQLDHGEVRTPGGGRLLHEADNYSHDQERALLEIESSDKLNQDKLNDSLQQQTDTEAEQSKYCDQETQVDVAAPEEAILVHFGDKKTQIEYEVEKPQYCDTETLVEPAELEGAILVQKEYTDGGSDNGEGLNQRGFEPESQEQAENEENSGESNKEAVPVSGGTDGQCEENTHLEKGREYTELLTAVSTDFEEQDISGPTLCDETEATLSQIQSDLQGENTQEYDPGTKGQVIPENSRITESEMIKMILRISVCLGEAKTSPNQISQGSLKKTETIGMEMKNHPGHPAEHQAETGQVTSTGTSAISSTVSIELFISECPDEVGIKTDPLIINTLSEFEKDTQNSLELQQHKNDHFSTESSVEIVPKITDSDGQKLSERVEELESSSVESKPDQIWQESVCGMKEDEPNTKELQAKEPPSTIADKTVTPIITEEGKTRLDKQVIPDLPEKLETSLENTLPGVQGDQKMDVAESREKQGCTCKCTCKQSESDQVLMENSLDVALTQRISDSSGEVISDRTEAVEPSPDRSQSESPSCVEREEWCIIEENIYEENLQQEAIQEEQQTEQGEASTSSPAGGDNELNDGASAGYIDSCEEAVLLVKEEETYLPVEEEHISSSPGPSALGQEIQPLPEAVEEGRERPPVEEAQKQESGVRKGQRGNRKGKGKDPCRVN